MNAVKFGAVVHVYAPATFWVRTIEYCPLCRRRRRFVSMHQLWYETTSTCCGCGDSWTGGYRDTRPFRRGWRDDASREARRRWATAGTRAQLRAWLAGQLAQEHAPTIINAPDISTWKAPDEP